MSHETHHSDQADPHNHKHTGDPDRLRLSDRFFEPTDRQIVGWLALAPGSRVLDAGCGGGGMTRRLAEVVGPGGQVVGLDANPALLEFGQAEVAGSELAARIHLQEGDVSKLPFEDGAFDLVWCSRVIHGLPDQLAGLRELARVTRPGGRVVIREGGLPLQFLPPDIGLGEPGLGGRLQVAQTQWFANWRASLPGGVAYPFGWSHMLREAGLSKVTPKSFLYEFTAPLAAYQQEYLEDWLNQRLHHEENMTAQDTATLAQLLNPAGPHYLFNRDDLHGIVVETIYIGYAT